MESSRRAFDQVLFEFSVYVCRSTRISVHDGIEDKDGVGFQVLC